MKTIIVKLFSSLQLRFPNSRKGPFFHNRKAPSDPSSEQVNVISRETTLFPAGHEAVILGKLLTQSFAKKIEVIFQPLPAFCEKSHLLAFSLLCESEEMIPSGLIITVEVVTVYIGRSVGGFSVVGCAEIAAMSRALADLPDHPQGQVPDNYDVKEVMN